MDEFHLLIMGPDSEPLGVVELDCEDVKEAMRTAASAVSPYGHDLFQGDRFIARFDPAWGRHLEDEES